jgi:ERO1-like protein alpha
MNNKTQLRLNLIVFQLQQQNEVIALMNLLNRLSESVKFVHEMGPTAERITKGHFFGHTSNLEVTTFSLEHLLYII